MENCAGRFVAAGLKPLTGDLPVVPTCRSPPSLISTPNQWLFTACPVPLEGRLAIVTDAGRDAVDAGRALDQQRVKRTAKPCGPDAPTLASSWRKQFRRRRWQK